MKCTNSKLIFVLVAVLLFVIAVLFACIYHTTLTAYADGVPEFVISTVDGENWELYYNGTKIDTATGQFTNPNDPLDATRPATIFYASMMSKLDSEDDDYNLTFELPTPTASFKDGIDYTPYTQQNDVGIVIEVSYDGCLTGVFMSLEYRAKDSGADFESFEGLCFGKDIPIGEYEVRVKVEERNYQYYGKTYSPVMYSATMFCRITEAEIPDEMINYPAALLPTFEYGTTLESIAAEASRIDNTGTWTVSEGVDASAMLDANEQAYMVNMDFESINPNYNIKKNVSVPVEIAKRVITVYIDQVNRLCGQPFVSEYTYIISGTFAPGDTAESLGFRVVAENVDVNTVGEYPIYAYVDSDNYAIYSRINGGSMHIWSGIYAVHPLEEQIEADDNREFLVTRPLGFIDIFVHIERMREGWSNIKIDGYTVIVGYSLYFLNFEGETIEEDLGALTIVMSKRADDYAIAYMVDGEWQIVLLDDNMTFTLPAGVKSFVVLKKNAPVDPNMIDWNASLTALCVLMVLFTVAIWVVIVAYFAKRRLLND